MIQLRIRPGEGAREMSLTTLTKLTTRTTETGSRDDRPHTGRHLAPDASGFSAPLPPGPKSPEIQGKTRGRPRVLPERDHQQDWVAVGAVSREPVSHVAKRIKDEYLMGPYYVPLHTP